MPNAALPWNFFALNLAMFIIICSHGNKSLEMAKLVSMLSTWYLDLLSVTRATFPTILMLLDTIPMLYGKYILVNPLAFHS